MRRAPAAQRSRSIGTGRTITRRAQADLHADVVHRRACGVGAIALGGVIGYDVGEVDLLHVQRTACRCTGAEAASSRSLLVAHDRAGADRVVALAPLSTLGAEDKSAGDEEAARPDRAGDRRAARHEGRHRRSRSPMRSTKAKKPQLKTVRGRRGVRRRARQARRRDQSWSPARSAASATRASSISARPMSEPARSCARPRSRSARRTRRSPTAPRCACSIPTSTAARSTSRSMSPGATVYVNGTKAQLVDGEDSPCPSARRRCA